MDEHLSFVNLIQCVISFLSTELMTLASLVLVHGRSSFVTRSFLCIPYICVLFN